MKKQILLALTALLSLSLSLFAAGVKNGDPAPDFTLTDSNGKEHSLSSYKGKQVVLEWTSFQCPFAVKHYSSKNMQGLQKKYTAKEVVWLTICSSAPGKPGHFSPEKWNAELEQAGAAPTALLIDADGTVGRKYGARTTPHMFVISADGKLAYQGAIDSVRGTSPKEVAGAENYVAAALDGLLAEQFIKTPRTNPYGCSIKY